MRLKNSHLTNIICFILVVCSCGEQKKNDIKNKTSVYDYLNIIEVDSTRILSEKEVSNLYLKNYAAETEKIKIISIDSNYNKKNLDTLPAVISTHKNIIKQFESIKLKFYVKEYSCLISPHQFKIRYFDKNDNILKQYYVNTAYIKNTACVFDAGFQYRFEIPISEWEKLYNKFIPVK